MSYHVTVTCPACGQPLEAEVDMIEETEGDSSIPYGTRTYMALEDYNICWKTHPRAASCKVIIDLSEKADDLLIERLAAKGGDAYDQETAEMRPRRQTYDNEHD